jgi:TonB family protein
MSALFLLTWLAGTLLPLGALWLVYRLALRGERCFGYNRAFLLLAPVLAAALPLLPRPAMPLWLNSPAVAVAASKTGVAVLLPTVAVGQATNAGAEWSVWTWLAALYLAGVALGLGRIAWQAGRLWVLARRLPREVRPGHVLAYTGGRLPTSSFGRVVFWDETANLAPAEAAAVLAHELAHVRQRHTLDVLWVEAWRAVLWLNPFSYLLLSALRLTHELLADAAAAPETGATAYPTLLARLAARQLGAPVHSSLLQPFTFSFTLTRIAMLQNQTSVRRWKQWLVLPVLSALSFVAGHAAIAQPVPTGRAQITPGLSEAQLKERKALINRKLKEAMYQDSLLGGKVEPGMVQQFNISNIDGPGEPVVTITKVPIRHTSVPLPLVTSSGHKVYTFVEQMPQLPGGGGQHAIVKAIQSKIVYPKAAPGETLPNGRVFASFVVDTDGTVQNINIVKGLSPPFDATVLAAIKQLPRFEPGMQNGQNVAVVFTVPVEFKAQP